MGLIGIQSNIPKNSNDEKIYLNMNQKQLDRLERVKLLYPHLKKKCMKLDFCYDISDSVPPIGDVYFDERHHNSKGNKMLAKVIWKTIKNNIN